MMKLSSTKIRRKLSHGFQTILTICCFTAVVLVALRQYGIISVHILDAASNDNNKRDELTSKHNLLHIEKEIVEQKDDPGISDHNGIPDIGKVMKPISQDEWKAEPPFIPNSWKPQSELIHRIILATIPRSGNGWFRGLLEAATGVVTESVFEEPNSVWRNRTEAYSTSCGWANDCRVLRQSDDYDPVIVKTHFPFTSKSRDIDDMVARHESDAGRATYLILPVRNPIDNYEAWIRYLKKKNRPLDKSPHTDFREFVHAWVQHHQFWYELGVPSFVYRYEDLIDQPFSVLARALQMSGLWSYFDMSDRDMQRVASIDKLKPYERKQVGKEGGDDIKSNFKKYDLDDIRWVLHNFKSVLRRYGYDELYSAWILAKTGAWDEERLLERVQAIMRRTAKFAVWGERYDGYQALVRHRMAHKQS